MHKQVHANYAFACNYAGALNLRRYMHIAQVHTQVHISYVGAGNLCWCKQLRCMHFTQVHAQLHTFYVGSCNLCKYMHLTEVHVLYHTQVHVSFTDACILRRYMHFTQVHESCAEANEGAVAAADSETR